ncbi:hypothetical protein AMAG_01671 [Allomyces macrogynus ATCC 38327]|uniref:NmrA-like domain-containing protein n=1 Tax=Allomyces macrogynus (strain ATCC 38327) TaxID=578462 RepID=A0A0L0RZN8_ALLM3|nr:hypothetical protein AMAG_01671 [Allomyces macrogynus ATCC 38327]|eukprot:KNE55798.1 hypothetical protein AMAG_01671 [Allomyces macrogynus ATCC 38327]
MDPHAGTDADAPAGNAAPETTMADESSKSKHPSGRKVFVSAGDSWWGMHAAREFLRRPNKEYNVTAGVADPNSPLAKTLKDEGATIVQVNTLDGDNIRQALSSSGAPTLILVPEFVPDMVIRCNNILAQSIYSIKSIVLWSSIGVDDSASIPDEDFVPSAGADGDDAAVDADADADDKVANPTAAAGDKPKYHPLSLLKEVEELAVHAVPDTLRVAILRVGFPVQHFFLLQNVIQNRGIVPFVSEDDHFAPLDLIDAGRATIGLLRLDASGGDVDSIPDAYLGHPTLLTGTERMSGPMLVTAANVGLGARLQFANVSMSDMKAFLQQTRLDAFQLAMVIGLWRLFDMSKLDVESGELPKLLDTIGDTPSTITEFFRRHHDQFAPPHPAKAKWGSRCVVL